MTKLPVRANAHTHIHRMSVFAFILFGFGTSSFVLVIDHYVQQGISLESPDLNPDANDFDYVNYIKRYFYVSLGDVSDGTEYSSFLIVLHL